MDFLSAILIGFSYFTIIPMPNIKWTENRMRYVLFILPFIGLVIGLGAYYLFLLLSATKFTTLLEGVIMGLYFLIITGGVHMDGLMDTSDAYFSRRTIERKLEIMKDSRVGAFAVMAFGAIIAVKIALFQNFFSIGVANPIIFIFIPIISRVFQPTMLYLFPFAKSNGLADMYGKSIRKYDKYMFAIYLVIISFLVITLFSYKYLLIIFACLLFYVLYFFSVKKNFGGITGDIMGAFLELSELIMLLVLSCILL